MALSRSELRNKCMIILYQIDIYNQQKTPYEVEEVIKENVEIENEFIKDIVYGVTTHQKELDELANEYVNRPIR